MSIVRGRGIDQLALRHLAEHHDPADVVFVDGWTGKGAIARELAAALAAHGGGFDPDLAVLADPGRCTRTFGTREDWLIPSACLNSTVSGLVSRTVLNDRLTAAPASTTARSSTPSSPAPTSPTPSSTPSPREFAARHATPPRPTDRTPDFAGWRGASSASSTAYGIGDVNLVKPGVGETTRVLLRRVPWKVLVRAGAPAADLAHVRLLAQRRGVPVEEVRRPALQLRRADPPALHPRRDRRRRAAAAVRGRPMTRRWSASTSTARSIYSAAALDLRVPDARRAPAAVRRGLPGRAAVVHDRGRGGALRALHAVATVVPTTTRTPEQLARVHLPGPPARLRDRRNGGHLLVDGVPGPRLGGAVRGPAGRAARRWPRSTAHLRAAGGRVRAEPAHGERPVRLRRRRPRRAAGGLGRTSWRAWCAPRGWAVSLQGRKVYAVPAPADQVGGGRRGARPAPAADRCSRRATRCSTPTCSPPPTPRSARRTASWPTPGSRCDHLASPRATGVRAGAELLAWLRDRGRRRHVRFWQAVNQRTTTEGTASWRCGTSSRAALTDCSATTKTQVGKFKSKDFAKASMAMCALIAAADGTHHRRRAPQDRGLHRQQRRAVGVRRPASCRSSSTSTPSSWSRDYDFGKVEAIATIGKLKSKPDAARAVIQVGIIIGGADGNFDDDEKQAVREACNAVGIAPSEFDL